MVHPTESDLQALADDELSDGRCALLRRHVDDCSVCGDRLRGLARAERELSDSLRLLDHPAPVIPVAAVLARAQSRRALRRPLMAAGLSALFAAAAAAAVIPGSPLNLYLGRVVGGWRLAPPTVSPRPAQPNPSQPEGVAIPPGDEVEVVFRGSQRPGEIRVSLAESPSVRVTGTDPNASYAVETARVTVDVRSSDGVYEIVLPRSVARARIRVGERVVFEKIRDAISTTGTADGAGRYRIPSGAVDARTSDRE
jgi:hypothetical protein